MSNGRKLRVPGRYERPATARGPLGDRATEAGIRAGYAAGNRARVEARRRELATVESAGTVTRSAVALHESVGGRITEAPQDTASGRLITIDIIRSGWNTSGSRYYPADVLERDVPTVYGKGTQMYIDHPSTSEGDDRPERSLQTLAGVFVDEPWAVQENGVTTMRTTARVFGPWQPLVREAWDTIGVSINGNGRGDFGTAEGREGLLIEALTYGRSVDFVTVPGAGGRVLGLLESDRPAPVDIVTQEAGSLGAFVESRIHLGFTQLGDELYGDGRVTRDERIVLSGAIGDALAAFVTRVERDAPQVYQRSRWAAPEPAAGDTAVSTEESARARTREATAEQTRRAIGEAVSAVYGGEKRYAWVEDYDPDLGIVWFTASSRNDDDSRSGMWQQSYVTSRGAVQLVGARVEVRQRTVYEPVPAGATTESTTRPAPATQVATTETTAGAVPAADDGRSVPAITTKEGIMPEKSAEVVAREALEARATNAEQRLARFEASETARPLIDQVLAESGLLEPARARVRAEYVPAVLPLIEANRTLDETTLRSQLKASVEAETTYVAQILEAAGVGSVRGAGSTAGAGTGIPVGYAGPPNTVGSTGSYFAAPAAAPVMRMTEADNTRLATIRESLIRRYTDRGITREAAEAAVDAASR